jgi:hypothetical protein
MNLNVTLNKAGRQFGGLLFCAPEGWQATVARVNGKKRRLKTHAPGIVGLGFTLTGSATVEVDFISTAPRRGTVS